MPGYGGPRYVGQRTRPQWRQVARELDGLRELLADSDIPAFDMGAFADGLARLAQAYRDGVRSEGRTSIRAEALVRALAMETPKSRLQAFVQDLPAQGANKS